ncbi:hypothetical protein [Streptomyces roseifaciens]|uniref:hypothetical protein n=1 Tax=Streptomyces roseifaciens TaxID=1488406 RepID=UPI000717E133|nr:hypothetical protein [Streptomyces roseifaciens]
MPNKGQQFRVDFEGISLPDEAVQRIEAAIRKAVLTELATVDVQAQTLDLLADDLTIGRIGGGHTQGIRVRLVEA